MNRRLLLGCALVCALPAAARASSAGPYAPPAPPARLPPLRALAPLPPMRALAPLPPMPALAPMPPMPPLPPHVELAYGWHDHDSDGDDDDDDDEMDDGEMDDGDHHAGMHRSELDDDDLAPPRVFAQNNRRGPGDDDDEGDEDDSRRRVHRRDRNRDRDEDDEDDRDVGDPTAQAQARNGVATLAVKGPVQFRIHAQSGDVEVVLSDKPQVSATLTETHGARDLSLVSYGDRVEVQLGRQRQLRRGRLHVELPRGSGVDVTSMSGDVSIQRVGGDVHVRSLSGDVKISGAGAADVQTVSGDVVLDSASKRVRLHTVSGDARLSTSDPAVQVDFESASGGLKWSGVCAKDCHLSSETVSGDVVLLADSKSSFELSFSSHSGDLQDEAQLIMKRQPRKKRNGGWVEAAFGKGEGLVECDSFSGNVTVAKR